VQDSPLNSLLRRSGFSSSLDDALDRRIVCQPCRTSPNVESTCFPRGLQVDGPPPRLGKSRLDCCIMGSRTVPGVPVMVHGTCSYPRTGGSSTNRNDITYLQACSNQTTSHPFARINPGPSHCPIILPHKYPSPSFQCGHRNTHRSRVHQPPLPTIQKIHP